MKPWRLWLYGIITRFIPETRMWKVKRSLIRWCGAKVGANVRISSSAVFIGNGKIEIGDDVWIGARDFIMSSAPAKVTIGKCCDIGPQVTIITGTHVVNHDDYKRIAGEGRSLSVSIGTGSWIGARTVLLPGVKLAERNLVAAGSVVTTSNQSSNVLLAGVPASIKKRY